MFRIDAESEVKVSWSGWDWLFEGVALAALLALVVLMLTSYGDLPASIPSHFDAVGKPDRFSSKATLFIPLAVAGVIYTLISVLSRFPQVYNYPFPVKPGTEQQHFAAARSMLIRLKCVIVCLFGYITWATIETAQGRMNGLGIGFLPIVLVGVFGSIAWYMLTAFRIRPEAEA